MVSVVLTVEEESLIEAVRVLAPGDAGKVHRWVSQLADLSKGRETEWSDAWSPEDMADAAAASVRELQAQEPSDS